MKIVGTGTCSCFTITMPLKVAEGSLSKGLVKA
jgi:hypothetical protein